MTSVTSLIYGVFLITAVPLYWLMPSQVRKHFLLATSLIFLGFISVKLLMFVMILASFGYLMGWAVYKGSRGRGLLIFGLMVVIGVLGYYKYTPMIVENLNQLIKLMGQPGNLTAPVIFVPVGISFITFKILHYLISCYKGEAPLRDFWSFLLYIVFFPIYTAGPIERWPNFASQEPVFSRDNIYRGLVRILIGIFKKKVLADNLIIFSSMLNAPDGTSWGYWIAAYAFAFQIYFDFSGYSDIAIGSARLFGYNIMENFNWPYLQRNISLFWKNWHMSLTSWFIQYVYIPLGGSRGTFLATAANTFIVMAITGLWHGAAWNFMLWGMYHGVGLIAWRLYGLTIGGRIKELWGDNLLLKGLSTLLTFHFVVVGWVFFTASFDQSIQVVSKMLFLR